MKSDVEPEEQDAMRRLFELVRRQTRSGYAITSPGDVAVLLRNRGRPEVENLWLVCVNGAHEVCNVHHIGMGLADSVLVHPREIFAPAICDRAVGIFLAHNHPSGNLQPSLTDHSVTQRVRSSGEIVGIELIDHVIFSDNAYFSFAEHNQLSIGECDELSAGDQR